MSKLNIFSGVKFQDSISKEEIHKYYPVTKNFGNCDEIRIVIQHEDLYTSPFESVIFLRGSVTIPNAETQQNFNFVRNGFAFLFEEIRYLLSGVEADKVRNVGVTTTIKGYLSYSKDQLNVLELAGWNETGKCKTYFPDANTFYALIPLNHLLGIAEDYQKVIINMKQELILIRARTDRNCYTGPDGVKINIDSIEWMVPHVFPNEDKRIEMEKKGLLADTSISIPFRKWELLELPALRTTNRDIWAVKTSRDLEKPRYVILAFQEEKQGRDSSHFDHCNIRNIKIYLNSAAYPYENLNLEIEKGNYLFLYYLYTSFQHSYYNNKNNPILNFTQFKERMLYVFDVSKQNESVKLSSIDLKIEMESERNFKENTKAYCLILYDNIVTYTPSNGFVQKVI